MDGFSIIQNFFSRMRCNFCTNHLEPEGIKLIQHNQGVYIVNVQCTHCMRQMGSAMVGLEGAEISAHAPQRFTDPELTVDELERLSQYEAIGYDDVLDAHQFFNNLDSDWQKFLPEEMRQSEIVLEQESEVS